MYQEKHQPHIEIKISSTVCEFFLERRLIKKQQINLYCGLKVLILVAKLLKRKNDFNEYPAMLIRAHKVAFYFS